MRPTCTVANTPVDEAVHLTHIPNTISSPVDWVKFASCWYRFMLKQKFGSVWFMDAHVELNAGTWHVVWGSRVSLATSSTRLSAHKEHLRVHSIMKNQSMQERHPFWFTYIVAEDVAFRPADTQHRRCHCSGSSKQHRGV